VAAERLHTRFFGEQINLEASPVEHLKGTSNIKHVTVVIDWYANDHGVALRIAQAICFLADRHQPRITAGRYCVHTE
jgi:hypothetical protein